MNTIGHHDMTPAPRQEGTLQCSASTAPSGCPSPPPPSSFMQRKLADMLGPLFSGSILGRSSSSQQVTTPGCTAPSTPRTTDVAACHPGSCRQPPPVALSCDGLAAKLRQQHQQQQQQLGAMAVGHARALLIDMSGGASCMKDASSGSGSCASSASTILPCPTPSSQEVATPPADPTPPSMPGTPPLAPTPPPHTASPSLITPHLTHLLECAKRCRLPPFPPAEPPAGSPPGTPNLTLPLALSHSLPPAMQRTHWCLADYVIRDKLYTGYASTVFKAQCKRSKEVVVLKVYTLPAVCDLYKYQIYREVNVHAQLRHANIVLLLAAFQEGDKVVMVQEYADGCDLFTLLHKYGGRLSERLAVQMVLEPFLRVLNYLHLRGIIHRDIKPENIMFTKNMVLKLGDFGLAIDMREERAVTRAGTLDYMAPEVLRCPYKSRPDENKDNRSLHYGARVDSWAAGVLAYELLVGFPPFFDQSRAATEDRIVNKSPEFSSIMSEEAKTFISRALHKSPTHRPTILEMLSHSWLEQFRVRRSLRDVLTMPTAPVGVPIAAAYPSPAMPALPPAPGTVLQAAPPCSQPPTAALATTNTRIRQEATLPSFSTATCPPAPVLQPTCDSYPATNLSPSGRVSAQAAAGPLPMTHHLSTISCGSPGALGAPMPARRFGQLEHDGPGFDCTPTPSTLVSQSMQPLGSLASSDSADISVIMNLSTSKALGSKEVAAMQTGSVLAMQR